MLSLFTEGRAKFYASPQQQASAKTPVFYNPVMKLNRDIAVYVAGRLKPKQICLGMEASGVRAIRFALEASLSGITANDASPVAVEAMKKNIELNNAEDAISVQNKDIKKLLSEGEAYDYIDIDPFGTPVYYAEPAIQALSENGVLAVTATDTSCLCGRFVKACIKKYSSRPLDNEFCKETGLRILIWKMQELGSKHGRALFPVFGHSSNHYIRAYMQACNNKGAVEQMKAQQGFILYCHKCLGRRVSVAPEGHCCGADMDYAGPLWLGSIWDESLVDGFTLIRHIAEESAINVPWHFDTHKIAKMLAVPAVRHDVLIDSLHAKGFKASRTHFKPEGVKTDAMISDFVPIFRQ